MTTSSSAASAPAAAQGIVVLGVPRTGTTLLRRLLNGHREICCPGETFLLTSAARFLRPDEVSGGIEYGVLGGLEAAGISRGQALADLRGLIEGSFCRIAARAGKPRWASKTAIDSFYVAEIEQLLAGHARFVCIVRHGLDTALSLKDLCDANDSYIREIHQYIIREPRPLVAFAQLWSDITASLLDFAQRRRSESIVVKYEDLVETPEAVLESLATFLALQPGSLSARTLNEDLPSGIGDWKTYGKPAIDASSVGRWRSLEPASLHPLVAVVNPVLARAGYETIAPVAAPDSAQAMRRYEITMAMQAKRSRTGNPDRG